MRDALYCSLIKVQYYMVEAMSSTTAKVKVQWSVDSCSAGEGMRCRCCGSFGNSKPIGRFVHWLARARNGGLVGMAGCAFCYDRIYESGQGAL